MTSLFSALQQNTVSHQHYYPLFYFPVIELAVIEITCISVLTISLLIAALFLLVVVHAYYNSTLLAFLFICIFMSFYTKEKFPSLKVPSTGVGGRKDKVGLWSAVALQQHFALTTTPQSNAIDVNVLPPAKPNGRLTLAQKMGLVPPPPPKPTDADWKMIESRAVLRTDYKRMDDSRCSICLEPFYQTMNQGQVILSCSHVFHELCFKQFEKLIRYQQRSEGDYASNILACPECRQTHYHKRCYYAGKALAQRSAIIKIQSAIRGYLTRKQYLKMRIKLDAKFRETFIRQRLASLSSAWEAYLRYRDAERERIMSSIDAKKQEALAAYLTESDWINIIDKRIKADKLAHCEKQLNHLHTSEGQDEEYNECPICMEQIRRRVFLHQPSHRQSGANLSVGSYGEEVVSGFRREYEEKRRQKELEKKEKMRKSSSKDGKGRSIPPLKAPKRNGSVEKHVNFSTGNNASGSALSPTPSSLIDIARYMVSPAAAHNRSNAILSCGHCFHESCLKTFEKYSQWRTTEIGYTVINRCPLCRAGYTSHEF